MATTKYRHASDRTVGTNSSSLIKPPGQAPQKYLKGGENLTPAPTKPVVEIERRASYPAVDIVGTRKRRSRR